MAGYDPGVSGLASLAAALADAFDGLGFGPDEFGRALGRMGAYRTCEPQIQPGHWVVEWVATREKHRERGHAFELLRHTLLAGRNAGFRRAQVSTMLGNHNAIRVYQRAGFKAAEELRHPEFERAFGSPGMMRMVAVL